MISIYHNPRCSKSREALDILKTTKIDHEIINYMDGSLSVETLKKLIKLLNIKPIELVRTNEPIWKENFKNAELSDDAIISAMAKHPKLIERPIIVHGNKAVIGRPPQKILEIL